MASKKDSDTMVVTASMTVYRCVDNIMHNGILHASGEPIELDDDSAQALLKSGAITTEALAGDLDPAVV